MDRRVGFVGIGLMGAPMTRRLATARDAGALDAVLAWNRCEAKADALASHGVARASSLAALATETDVLALCLSDTAAVDEVVRALLPHLRPGQLVVDFSSIAPDATRRLASEVATRGAAWVDAPVSGGVVGAENGTLAIMAGGTDADVVRARAIGRHLGRRFTHVGPVGSGQVAKICNQMIVACNAMVLAEVVGLAEANGMDASALPEALRGGFADSIPFQLLVPRMAERRFEPVQWRVRTLLKDLDMALALASDAHATTPMSAAAAALYRRHADAGHATNDPSTLVLLHRGAP